MTLVAGSLYPQTPVAPVYADAAPTSIIITPTGFGSCEIVSDLDVIASYSLTNTDSSKLSTPDYYPKNTTGSYNLEGLEGITITSVTFSAKTSVGNVSFNLDYYLNGGDRVRVMTNFESLYGKQSDEYVELTAPFAYPLSEAEEFRFVINVSGGVMNVQSITITYEETLDPFAKSMLNGVSCDESGVTPPSVEEWNAAKEAYETLSVEEQAKYQTAIADFNGDTYQRVVAKYDYILSKYGKVATRTS